jgi:hypothetical protein
MAASAVSVFPAATPAMRVTALTLEPPNRSTKSLEKRQVWTEVGPLAAGVDMAGLDGVDPTDATAR